MLRSQTRWWVERAKPYGQGCAPATVGRRRLAPIALMRGSAGCSGARSARTRGFSSRSPGPSRYISNNVGFIANYAERHRYGEVVSTAFVESTVNQVIAKRFAKEATNAMDTARRPSPHSTANPRARRHSRQRLQALAQGAAEIRKCIQVGRLMTPTFSCSHLRVSPARPNQRRVVFERSGHPRYFCRRPKIS